MFKKWLICLFLIIYSFAFGYSEQVVVSQFDINLRNSANYVLGGATTTGNIKATTITNKDLAESVNFNYSENGTFTGSGTYSYGNSGGTSVIIPVQSSTTASTKGTFQLIEKDSSSGETITNYLIDQEFKLPKKDMQITNTVNPSASKGVKFTYSETSKISDYKRQNYMIRISRNSATTDDTYYDIVNKKNGVNFANTGTNAELFLNKTNNYVDFLVSADQYEGEQSVYTNAGLGIKYIPGSIEVLGLPNGSYRMEVYSFRYTNEYTNRGSLIITQELVTNSFVIGNTSVPDSMEVLGFDTSEFPNITAQILTISSTQVLPSSLGVTEAVGTISDLNKTEINTGGNIYLTDGTAIVLDATGKGSDNNYYQKWKITYKSGNTTVDTTTRKSTFSGVGTAVSIDYLLYVNNVTAIEDYPHQTVFALLNNSKDLNGIYEIADKNMNKYTFGYRGIKEVSDTTVDTMYTGNYSATTTMGTSNYDWSGTGNARGLVINKAISNSKGEFKQVSGTGPNISMPFYTLGAITDFTYNEEADTIKYDSATFRWTNPEKSSYDTTLSLDKIIFRVVRLGSNASTVSENYTVNGVSKTETLPRYYYNPYKAGTYDKLKNSSTDISNFVDKTNDYVDLVFESGISKTEISSNVNFVYTASNNSLGITGLTRDNYLVQIYSLQDADTESLMYTDNISEQYDYKVLTYGGFKAFKIGDEQLESSAEMLKKNNVFVINSINYEDDETGSTRDVTVEFKTKSSQQLSLTNNNIYFTSGSAVYTKAEESVYKTYNKATGIGTVDTKRIGSASVDVDLASNYFYPLDIVFVIDNSGSMGNEITTVKNKIKSFSAGLKERNFDVSYNLITFGGPQDGGAIGSSWVNKVKKEDPVVTTIYTKNDLKTVQSKNTYNYLATFKQDGEWFDGSTPEGIVEFENALTSLNASSGYPMDQENGAPALGRAITYLNENGRYLAPDNKISSEKVTDSYLPSKKWIIFLTDENMDSTKVITRTAGRTVYTGTNVLGYASSDNIVQNLAQKMYDNGVVLTGIYNLNAYTSSPTTYATNFNAVYATEKGAKPVATAGSDRVTIKDSLSDSGLMPADTGDIYYNDFVTTKITTKKDGQKAPEFYPYEMGSDGANIEKVLSAAVENIGVIQAWKMTYKSPFTESDGKYRKVDFNIGKVFKKDFNGNDTANYLAVNYAGTESDKFYEVSLSKIDAIFKNPDPSSNYLIKKSGGIELKAIAQSLYEKDGEKVNKPIIKGTFKIKSSTGATLLTRTGSINEVSDGERDSLGIKAKDTSVWYKSMAYIKESDGAIAIEILKGKYTNLKVEFIAETSEESKMISMAGVKVVEKDQPKVTSLTMTNVTLKDFMDDLKKSDGTSTFDSDSINKATAKTKSNDEGLTADDLNVTTTSSGIELNVKDGDKVKLEFTIDDESITSTSAGIKVIYNNKPYVATYVGAVANTTKTNWKVELDSLVYKKGIDNISFNITDDSVSPNTTAITADVFNQPEMLDNTLLKAPSNTKRFSDEYYNNGSVSVVNVTGALAYLVVFDYDKTVSDTNATTGTYPISGGKKWISYSSNEFNFFEGKYTYNKTVYVMNSAGAIKSITHNSNKDALIINSGSIGNIIGEISTGISNFYVDKQAPSVTDFNFKKDSDPNLSDSSLLNNNSVASGILLGTISSVKLYKEGDGISVNFNLKEVNFFKTILSQVSGVDIVSNPTVTIGGTTATVDAVTGLEGAIAAIDNKAYKKSGIAVDLTSGDSAINSNMSLTVYDRAGNGTTQTFVSYYDDRIPNGISIASQVTDPDDNTIKFTNNVNFPLNSRSGTNYSVGLLSNLTGSLKHVGDITTSGAINLTSFETNSGVSYNPVLNAVNYPVLRSFSKSGKSGSVVKETVVLDTKINDARSSITETVYTYNSGSYVVDLTNTLKTIGELVGLKSYSISSSSNGAKLQHGITTDNISAVNTLVNLDTESLYRDTIGTTEYTSINNIILASSGNTKFKLILTDRLDNTKEIEYIVQIPNNVNIIGKKENSNKIINTKIDNSTKVIKIKSRIE